jgi:uridine kinase
MPTDVRLPPGRSGTASGSPAAATAEPTRPVRTTEIGQVTAAVTRWQADRPAPPPLVVAIDGPGASGKSTIAQAIAAEIPTALVHTDDFFLPTFSTDGVRRPLVDYYDWRRLRAEALAPLLAGHIANFRRFDWQLGALGGPVTVTPSGLIVLEGVFSAAPVLSDLVDRAIFVETAEPERIRRLRGRVTPEEWDDDWLAAERAYYDRDRPPSSFDLIVPGIGRVPDGSDGTAW